MLRFYLVGFFILMVFDTVGQIGFKLAAMGMGPLEFTPGWISGAVFQKWIYVAVLGYIGAFVTYLTLLRKAPVGPAFAASHLEIVSTLILSVLLLGESLSLMQIGGGVLIILGILVFAWGESREEQEHEA